MNRCTGTNVVGGSDLNSNRRCVPNKQQKIGEFFTHISCKMATACTLDSNNDRTAIHPFVCYPGLKWNKETCSCDSEKPCNDKSRQTYGEGAFSLKCVVYLMIGELLVLLSMFALWSNRQRCLPSSIAQRSPPECQTEESIMIDEVKEKEIWEAEVEGDV